MTVIRVQRRLRDVQPKRMGRGCALILAGVKRLPARSPVRGYPPKDDADAQALWNTPG